MAKDDKNDQDKPEGDKTDPVEKINQKRKTEEAEKKLKVFDISNLKLSDFKAIPKGVAKTPHPFDGYPAKQPIKIGVTKVKGKEEPVMVSLTHIIALHPSVQVFQDPSGKHVSHMVNGKEGFVDIESLHSRCVKDFESGGFNMDIVFDRALELGDGNKLKIAVCPSPSARAQICFKLTEKTGKIDTDDRYLLPDQDQANRLRRLFEMIHNPRVRAERLARAITGESLELLEEVPEAPLESKN